jgi:aspartyl-tRNA(Asn)/glutamyl-tRNA(Gln) amidotransferase subunit C
MTQKVDIKALAKLARLEVSDEELVRLEKEIPAILGFVETIQKVATDSAAHDPSLRNVMREDANPHEGGKYTDDLLAAAPAQRDSHVVVKQVISKKK